MIDQIITNVYRMLARLLNGHAAIEVNRKKRANERNRKFDLPKN